MNPVARVWLAVSPTDLLTEKLDNGKAAYLYPVT